MNRIARVAPTNATETGTIPMSQADEALRRVIADRLVRPVLEEHERVKDPLPTRPPRPHPQGSARTILDFSRPSTAAARIDMSAPDGDAIRATVQSGGHLELHDSTRPDVAPIVLDDFLMAVMCGEVA
ncbi:hypothetical protein [Streptomyces bluensis]|uniref:hypothetical protein n=1 Tax=Streptomyces bluensis TaxID=33897 RepID=UPI00332A2E52